MNSYNALFKVVPSEGSDRIWSHLSSNARLQKRFEKLSSAKTHNDTINDIRHNLAVHGIDFEGKPLPVSLLPISLWQPEVESIAKSAVACRLALEKVITGFVNEHKKGQLDGPFHRFFTPYYKWWDMIAAEKRTLPNIGLMRFDAARDRLGNWLFMETNTACPGGTIHCARIRDAWLMTALGNQLTRGEKIISSATDSPEGFVRYLAKTAFTKNPATPSIAILNYRGVYSNELESLKAMHAALRERGEIEAGELLLGDLREITVENGVAKLRGITISLIHNKIDQLEVDPTDPELRGWILASQCEGTDFLNSLGAQYLTEAKRSLAALSNPEWRTTIGISEKEYESFRDVIPFTRLISDFADDIEECETGNMLMRDKNMFVIKADALTRGVGVWIGDQMLAEDWRQAIEDGRKCHGVVQMKCYLPERQVVAFDEHGNQQVVTEFYGLDVFMFGDDFSGIVSRCHTNQVFNIGSGGREVPVLVLEGL